MADARIEHIFNCSEDTFWNKLFLDEEYNRRLFKEALEFPVWKEAPRQERGDGQNTGGHRRRAQRSQELRVKLRFQGDPA